MFIVIYVVEGILITNMSIIVTNVYPTVGKFFPASNINISVFRILF